MAQVWWPYAIQHVCFASNIEVVDGDSAWNKRHKQGHFKGDLFPFGSKVYFHPTPPKAKKQHKFEGKGKPGIFLRYFVKSGGIGPEPADMKSSTAMTFRQTLGFWTVASMYNMCAKYSRTRPSQSNFP